MDVIGARVEPTFAALQVSLDKVLRDVRAGRFGPELTADAAFLFRHAEFFKRAGDELSFIRAYTLRWEIHDQASEYEIGSRILKDIAHQHLSDFETCDPRQLDSKHTPYKQLVFNRRLVRQKVMCCLGYGFAQYRLREYKEAERVFNACANFLRTALIRTDDSPPFHCWGTQARLHYFRGHLHRVQGEFVSARAEFVKALDLAYLRLEEKRVRSQPPKPEFHVEEQFANHCAGKVLGFGLGWTSLLQGKLANAGEQLQAARVVLNDSHDEHLKQQIEMLSCAVQSAQNGISAESEKLLKRIETCCEKLKEHAEYYYQSVNEFAKTSINVAKARWASDRSRSESLLQEAQARVERVLRAGSETNKVIGNVQLSRIATILAGDDWSEKAETLAEKAYKLVHETASPAPLVGLAAIAWAEVLGRSKNREKRTRALRLLEEAMRCSRDHLIAQMSCHLHLTQIYLSLGDIFNATKSFDAWLEHASSIEHGWLIQKAEALHEQLQRRMMYVVDFDDKRTFKKLSHDFFEFLIDREILKQEQKGHNVFDPQQAAANLDIDLRTFIKWQEKRRNLIEIELQYQ